MAAGRLVVPAIDPVVALNGNPVANAVLTVYDAGTTDLAELFTDPSMESPMENPLTSDSGGYFYDQSTTIWADVNRRYDLNLVFPTGSPGPFSYQNIDPISPPIDISGLAPIDSPNFTGVPTAPTPASNDSSNQIATTSFVSAYVASSVPASVLSGAILMFGSASSPSGYLPCDGTAVSRATYARLFSVIGTVWGAGDGSTTFNIPDLRGVFPRGLDSGRGYDPGRVFGTYQADDYASHTHPLNPPTGLKQPGTGFGFTGVNGFNSNFVTATAASGGSETRPKNVAVIFIIKT